VPDRYRITRWFVMAHRLGHHTSDPQAEGARRRPDRSIKFQPNQGRRDQSSGTANVRNRLLINPMGPGVGTG
jgi:hypothetical protein